MGELINDNSIVIFVFSLTTFISFYFYQKYLAGYGGRTPGFSDNFKMRYFSLDDIVLIPPGRASKQQKNYLLFESISAAFISLVMLWVLII